MSTWDKHVLPHGKLQALAPNLWQVTGSLPHGPLPRNMAVYRFPNKQLLVHSAIALDKPTITDLESLGTPSWLLVPSGLHRLDAAVYKSRYPAMQVICPRAARARVEKVVKVDAVCEDVLPPLGVGCLAPAGLRPGELVYDFALSDGRALVMCDTLFNLRAARGLDMLLLKLLGSAGFFGITRLGRLLKLKDKAAFKAWLIEQAARRDLKVIAVAHGEAITTQTSQALSAAAERL